MNFVFSVEGFSTPPMASARLEELDARLGLPLPCGGMCLAQGQPLTTLSEPQFMDCPRWPRSVLWIAPLNRASGLSA
jgi:hypothetical protein